MWGELGLTIPEGLPFGVDLGKLVGSHVGIVAMSGGGKSGLVRRLLESTHGHIQHIVLDGEDEFYTLREKYDYVIAGGEDGDMPATLANPETLAIAALTHEFSLIAQINELGFEGAPEFVGRFLTALVNSPRKLWHPVLVVVDEAQRFVPRGGATGATRGVQALISQGRKRGFTAVLAGTKFSEIDPPVRGGIHNWMLGMAGQELDRSTMGKQLGFGARDIRDKLASLEPRQFWAHGPSLSREPALFRVGDVETTPIHAGQAKVPTPPPPEALRAILAGLTVAEPTPAAVPETGSDYAESYANMQRQVSDVSGQLAELWRDRDDWRDRALAAEERAMIRAKMIGRARAALQEQGEEVDEIPPAPPQASPPATVSPEKPKREHRPSLPAHAPDGPHDETSSSRKMIAALARHHPRAFSIGQITKMAGVSMRSSEWRRNLAAFTGSPLVAPLGDDWRISERGIEELKLRGQPDDYSDLVRFWVAAFPPSTGTMLATLIGVGGLVLSREELARRAGISPTSSGLPGGIRELLAHGLIDETSKHHYRANAVMLP